MISYRKVCISTLFLLGLIGWLPGVTQTRYWVHKPFYENHFGGLTELNDWMMVENNGTGNWIPTGTGTALLTMDDAAGGYATRLFAVNGPSPRLLPLDRANGRVEIMVKAITGGNQRIFVQVQEFDASNKLGGTVDFHSDILVADTLELIEGVLQTNAYKVRLGISPSQAGTLLLTNGRINGSFQRWLSTTSSGTMMFPFGNLSTNAPLRIFILSPPTTGGLLIATYTDVAPGFTNVNFYDNVDPIILRSHANWYMQASGISGGSYNISASSNHLGGNIAPEEWHLTLANSVAGLHAAAGGTTTQPVLYRVGLGAGDFSQTYYASRTSSVHATSWLSFHVKSTGDMLTAVWEVASANDIDHFEVEYSRDGVHFISAGAVEATEASNIYEYSSKVALDGNVYCRIKSIEKDGTILFSRTEKLRIDHAGRCTIYPNPVQGEVYIRWPYHRAGRVHVALTTTDGRMIYQTELDAKPLMQLDMPSIASGLYRILLTQDGQQSSALLHKL